MRMRSPSSRIPCARKPRSATGGSTTRSSRPWTIPPRPGLPRRPWYVHQIYAPGFYTGYGVKTLPAVREALEQRNWKEATEQMPNVAAAIEAFAKEVDRATAVLGK